MWTPQCGAGDFCTMGAVCSTPCRTSSDCPLTTPGGTRPICTLVDTQEYRGGPRVKRLGCVSTCSSDEQCEPGGLRCSSNTCWGCGSEDGNCN
jgi:hypothetical protein